MDNNPCLYFEASPKWKTPLCGKCKSSVNCRTRTFCMAPEVASPGILHESICMKSPSYYELRNARHTFTPVPDLSQKKCDGWLIFLLFHSFVLEGFRQCYHISPLWVTAFVPVAGSAEIWQGVTVTMPCMEHPYEHGSRQNQQQHNWRVSLMVCIDGVDSAPRCPSSNTRL